MSVRCPLEINLACSFSHTTQHEHNKEEHGNWTESLSAPRVPRMTEKANQIAENKTIIRTLRSKIFFSFLIYRSIVDFTQIKQAITLLSFCQHSYSCRSRFGPSSAEASTVGSTPEPPQLDKSDCQKLFQSWFGVEPAAVASAAQGSNLESQEC